MKKNQLAVLSLVAISTLARAELQLNVVKDYNLSATPEVWKKARPDQVPDALLGPMKTNDPTSSYATLFPNAFLQQPTFAVCYHDCHAPEIFKVVNKGINTLDGKRNWDIIEQSNVYYWLNNYFKFLDQHLSFQPKYFLQTLTDRVIKDEVKGKKLTNNAFFNPKNITLNFLPAKNHMLFGLFGGKINRSGFDPSVVAHEASHFLFYHYYPSYVNEEISGLNEGFADYVAHTFLENPKIGMIMLQGKALRDASSVLTADGAAKVYQPGLEAHDQGERMAFLLWQTRNLADDKAEADKMVIDAVAELGQSPYSTIHDFKRIMKKRFPQFLTAQRQAGAEKLWDLVIPGEANTIANLDFLTKSEAAKVYFGFKLRNTLPQEVADSMGVPATSSSHFTIVKEVKVADKQNAILVTNEDEKITTPYWYVVDETRGNVLGIFSADHRPVTDKTEIEKLSSLTEQVLHTGSLVSDFVSKLKSFADLSEGKGDFSVGYKVTNKTVQPEAIDFNSGVVQGQRIAMDIKKKFFISLIVDLPGLQKIELVTVPLKLSSKLLPVLGDQTVIGYSLQFNTGTKMEVVLDKLPESKE